MRVIEITDAHGSVAEPAWLARAEGVHRQLRPGLPADYRAALERVFASGARMCVAAADDAEPRVLGVAVWREYVKTSAGRELYVDDLVTDEASRSRGVGRLLLGWCERRARHRGFDTLALDSGVQRAAAHRFYFREGMSIPAFHFSKILK